MKYSERFFRFFLNYRILQTNFKVVVAVIFILAALHLVLAILMHASGSSLIEHKLPINEICLKPPCILNFRLQKATTEDIYIYIGYEDFYLNHRKIMNSVEIKQLQNQNLESEEIENKCSGFTSIKDARRFYPNRFVNRTDEEILNPCGLYPLLFTECIDK